MRNVAGSQDISPSSLITAKQKLTSNRGWLSRETYEDLLPRYQQAARELEKRGEIQIEG